VANSSERVPNLNIFVILRSWLIRSFPAVLKGRHFRVLAYSQKAPICELVLAGRTVEAREPASGARWLLQSVWVCWAQLFVAMHLRDIRSSERLDGPSAVRLIPILRPILAWFSRNYRTIGPPGNRCRRGRPRISSLRRNCTGSVLNTQVQKPSGRRTRRFRRWSNC